MLFFQVCFLVAVIRLESNALVCEETGFDLKSDPNLATFIFQCPSEESYPDFKLHTRTDREGSKITCDEIPTSYVSSGPVYLIVHGWQSYGSVDWVVEIKNAFLDKEDANIITVNWGEIAKNLDYYASAYSTPYVGSHIAKLIEKIRAVKGQKTYVWCVGHSLGAHVCHYASYKLTPVFNRISGLDPAGPMFNNLDRIASLNPTSAQFVDVLHTSNVFGAMRPLGHVDFYPNGGKTQAGCFFPTSSHQMAYIFFTQSIKNNCYASILKCEGNANEKDFNFKNSCSPCKDCLPMGYNCRKPTDEEFSFYYLQTSRKQPYCGV